MEEPPVGGQTAPIITPGGRLHGADAEDKPGYGRLRRRRNILLAIVGLAVAAAVGGLLVSTTIKSPAQQAAETKAPGLTRLTAPVVRTVIKNVVQADGVIGKPTQISSLNAGAGGGGGGGSNPGTNVQQVVTKIFLPPGSAVSPGNVIIEVAGRPLFVLPGTVPAYRDMAPGETGNDVAQLQAGLTALGFSTGSDASGAYGAGTAAAVAAFYQNLGYTVPKVTAGPKADRGPEVPLSEIMFVPSFPAHVVKLGGKVGSVVSGSFVTLSMGDPGVKGQLNPAYAALVRAGMRVVITAQGSNSSVRGTIVSVGSGTSTAKSVSGGIYTPMKIQPNHPLPPAMGPGSDVILSIKATSSAPMIAVPEAAVFASPDGKTYVSKATGPNSATKVPVVVVTEGDGLVGVTPVPAGALKPGDLVITGQNYLTNPLHPGRVLPGKLRSGRSGSGSFTIVGPG